MAITKTTLTKHKNMGNADRIVRTALGSLILLKGLLTHKKFDTFFGATFLLYGLTGYDPLLKLVGASTIIGAENNLLHQLKQTTPGTGTNPRMAEQAQPQTDTRSIAPDITFEHATRIE